MPVYNIVIFTVVLMVLGVVLAPSVLLASGHGYSVVDPLGDGGPSTIESVIAKISGWLQALALPLGALFIILAAIKFVTSRGSEQKVSEGKRALTYAVIGVILTVLGVGLVAVVQSILGVSTG